MSVDQITGVQTKDWVDQMSVGEIVFDQMFFDQKTSNPLNVQLIWDLMAMHAQSDKLSSLITIGA